MNLALLVTKMRTNTFTNLPKAPLHNYPVLKSGVSVTVFEISFVF